MAKHDKPAISIQTTTLWQYPSQDYPSPRVRVTRCSKPQREHLRRTGRKVGTLDRVTASFRWLGQAA